MNVSNARNAMSANKNSHFKNILRHAATGFLAFAFVTILTPMQAHAQSAAPALFDVKDIVLQGTRFGDPKVADSCGLVREDLGKIILKVLQDNSLPAENAADAKPAMIDQARIDLRPEVFSFNNGGLDCVSWVSLTADSQNNLRVPPVDATRSVSVTYWRQGLLLTSGQSVHARVVGEALQKLAIQFAQKFRLDQPPALPALPAQ
jgi:hypothetical protein